MLNLLPNLSFLVHLSNLIHMLISLPPEVFNPIDHSILVPHLIVVLVVIESFHLLLFRGVGHLCPDVDGHQLHGVEVGGLQASAHWQSTFTHVVSFVEMSDVAIPHTSLLVSMRDIGVVQRIIVFSFPTPFLMIYRTSRDVPVLKSAIVVLLTVIFLQSVLE